MPPPSAGICVSIVSVAAVSWRLVVAQSLVDHLLLLLGLGARARAQALVSDGDSV
ncbi:hypothetical protein DEO72_LG1g1320 [Vigna unguiculata]|uniref:Uncharacterized protein n=1 Tax=Vigna unguiculata TaxID=3917 RepID=A0A4D6KMH9_VIGUN|nr:hypothetical protein DEO72_LG1g1320 [Vigna unguiculata]